MLTLRHLTAAPRLCAVLWLCTGLAVFPAAPVAAQDTSSTPYDDKAAVIFAYFSIGQDSNPYASLRLEQFTAQMEELTKGEDGYNVLPLPDIVAAFREGATLPPRSVALTFDGADISVFRHAAPYLLEHKLPFTIFIPTDAVQAGKPPYMHWEQLRQLAKSGLVSFGLHPASYSPMLELSEEDLRRQINNALSMVRTKLKKEPKLFAYPFGESHETFRHVVEEMGFDAAFGQQSGVAHAGEDRFVLPRFTQTERYGDLERFRMTANALPLPVRDLSPISPYVETATPAIGFTLDESLIGEAQSLSCFSSSTERPDITILHKDRIELRTEQMPDENRLRINCTMPVHSNDGTEPRWRWYGVLYTIKPGVISPLSDNAPEGGEGDGESEEGFRSVEQ